MAGAEEAAEKQMEIVFAQARAVNISTAKYYAAAISGIIALAALLHWTRVIADKHRSGLGRWWTSIVRPLARLSADAKIGPIVIHPSRVLLALSFFAVNIILAFQNLDWMSEYGLVVFAKRMGWLALCNLVLTVFLGLKNTPLSPIAGKSYDSLNALHRSCGYTVLLFVLLHLTTYVSGLSQLHALTTVFIEPSQHAAIAAGVCMLLIGLTALGPVRKRVYEAFVLLHMLLVVGVLIALIFHLRDKTFKAVIFIIFAASIWFADRSLRLSRWLFHSYKNYCTLTPLPSGAVRVTMQRPIKAQPGSHAFLWIPGIRAFQTHPFTLVSNAPNAEFVIHARNGFTRSLYEAALKDPNSLRRAAIEGPYGHIPSFTDADKVVLVAGGSGASFTFALAAAWIAKSDAPSSSSSSTAAAAAPSDKSPAPQTLDFVWSVRHPEQLAWFHHDLARLAAHPNVRVHVHVTSGSASETSSLRLSTSTAGALPIKDPEAAAEAEAVLEASSHAAKLHAMVAEYRRVDLAAVLADAAAGFSSTKTKLLVAACGPDGLLTAVREATSELAFRRDEGPGIELHVERFDW